MALTNLATIVGLTPAGELRVVAGTGPKGSGDGDGRAVRARLGLVERLAVGPDGGAINALADGPPEEIADDVDRIVDAATDREGAQFEIQDTMQPDEDGVSLGEYAEDECGWVAGFDVPIEDANEFCVAYGRYVDQGDRVAAGEEVPSAYEDVVEAAPDFLAEAGRETLRELDRSAGREVPDSESALAGAEAIETVAAAMCASA
jgi:hypothetical protein